MLVTFALTIEVKDDFPKHLAPVILDELEDQLNRNKELNRHNWSVYDLEYAFDEEGE